MLNSGKEMAAVFQSLEISEATYHRWRAQYGRMKSDEANRLKELEVENSRLKRLLADAELDKAMLKEALRGNGSARRRSERPFSEFKKSLRCLSVGLVMDLDFVVALCVTSVASGQMSFNSRLRYELLLVEQFANASHARVAATAWCEDYNAYRPHSSLNGVPPAEFASLSATSAAAPLPQHRDNLPDSVT